MLAPAARTAAPPRPAVTQMRLDDVVSSWRGRSELGGRGGGTVCGGWSSAVQHLGHIRSRRRDGRRGGETHADDLLLGNLDVLRDQIGSDSSLDVVATGFHGEGVEEGGLARALLRTSIFHGRAGGRCDVYLPDVGHGLREVLRRRLLDVTQARLRITHERVEVIHRVHEMTGVVLRLGEVEEDVRASNERVRLGEHQARVLVVLRLEVADAPLEALVRLLCVVRIRRVRDPRRHERRQTHERCKPLRIQFCTSKAVCAGAGASEDGEGLVVGEDCGRSGVTGTLRGAETWWRGHH